MFFKRAFNKVLEYPELFCEPFRGEGEKKRRKGTMISLKSKSKGEEFDKFSVSKVGRVILRLLFITLKF